MTGSLPRRYARALIGLAREEDCVQPMGEGLEGFLRALQQVPQVLEALGNDSFGLSERLAAMKRLAARAGLHEVVGKFLLLLVKKNRIGLLPEIVREYRKFHDEILGIVRVVVAGPTLPEPLVLRRIEKILGMRLKKQILAGGEARPEMIGGLILKIDHTIYDGSLRRDLERLRETMMRGS